MLELAKTESIQARLWEVSPTSTTRVSLTWTYKSRKKDATQNRPTSSSEISSPATHPQMAGSPSRLPTSPQPPSQTHPNLSLMPLVMDYGLLPILISVARGEVQCLELFSVIYHLYLSVFILCAGKVLYSYESSS